MDKEKLSYLADISTVCTQIRSMLNSTSVPKNSLQKLSAKVSYLEGLFINTLLEATATTDDPGDDYNKKLQEARQEVLNKKKPAPVIPVVPTTPVSKFAPPPQPQNALKKLSEAQEEAIQKIEELEKSVEEDAADESEEDDVEPAGFTLASVVSPKKTGRPKKNAQ